jgi:hypothetical protein
MNEIYIGNIALVIGIFTFLLLIFIITGICMLFMGEEDKTIPPFGALIIFVSCILMWLIGNSMNVYEEIAKEEKFVSFTEWGNE